MTRIPDYCLYVIVFFLVSSCTPTLKLVYGVHKPRLETPASIRKYVHQKELDEGIVLVPKDSASHMYLVQQMRGIPDLYLFDTTGTVLKYSLKEGCNAPVFDITETICHNSYIPVDSLDSFFDFLKYVKPLSAGDSLIFNDMIKKEASYYTIITWSKYSGYLNKDHVKPWLESLMKPKDCSVTTFLLNMDFVTSAWTKEQYEALNIKY